MAQSNNARDATHDSREPRPEAKDPAGDEPRAAPNAEGLKASGLKATVPRMKILSLFERSSVRHLSAEDVYRLLLADERDIGLATVYRVLTQFEQAGLLQRHHFESGKAVFELNDSSHHDHIVCMQCGRVEEFYDEEIERRQSAAAASRGFAIRAHSLYVYADCTRSGCPNREGGRE